MYSVSNEARLCLASRSRLLLGGCSLEFETHTHAGHPTGAISVLPLSFAPLLHHLHASVPRVAGSWVRVVSPFILRWTAQRANDYKHTHTHTHTWQRKRWGLLWTDGIGTMTEASQDEDLQ